MLASILVVDDEAQIRRALSTTLRAAGYEVKLAVDGEEALAAATAHPPDIVILDLEMPRLSGLETILQLREWATMPIIVLSAHANEREKVAALDAGADDYLTKPFGMHELLARIRAAIRRTRSMHASETELDFGRLKIDLTGRIVRVDDAEVRLTPTEYDLLIEMATNADRVLTHQMLLQRVWGPASEDSTHYLRVYINHLRQKIERDPSRPEYLITDPGIGYRFRSPEQAAHGS